VTAPLLATPLVAWHESHGGRMVDFAGWRMPVQYASIVDEHVATRTAAGMFDVSHMGRLLVEGPRSQTWLESLLTRRVADSADGTPRLALVVNASNRARVVAWLESRLPDSGVALHDRTLDTAMIAVQGPRALEIVTSLCPPSAAARIAALKNYSACAATVAHAAAVVSRTGYTGEDGVEAVVAAGDAQRVWAAIHEAGAPRGLRACGLGARDTLRLEAGMPLYGHELMADSDPFAIGLELAVNLDGVDGRPRDFPGADRFRRLRAEPAGRVRVGLVGDSKRAAREGSVVRRAGVAVGVVTSGSYCPTLGRAAALALVDRDASAPGTELEVVVRDQPQAARVVRLPFYKRPPDTGLGPPLS